MTTHRPSKEEDAIPLQEKEMVFKLFKSEDDFYNTGKELIKRGEYAKARDYLQESINKDGGINDTTVNVIS